MGNKEISGKNSVLLCRHLQLQTAIMHTNREPIKESAHLFEYKNEKNK